jgi:hypothetical protein
VIQLPYACQFPDEPAETRNRSTAGVALPAPTFRRPAARRELAADVLPHNPALSNAFALKSGVDGVEVDNDRFL